MVKIKKMKRPMNGKKFLFASLALLLSFSMIDTAEAQDNRRGTAGATHLLVPLTAKTASIGSGLTGGLSTANALENVISNPAGMVASNTNTALMFSRSEYLSDVGINYMGFAQSFAGNTVALTLSTWDLGDIPTQTVDNPEISDQTWNASIVTVGASFARQLTDRIAAGLTAKLISEGIDDVDASGVAFDAGMTYVVGESGLRFGVALKNFGPQMQYAGTGLVRNVEDVSSGAVLVDAAGFELPSSMNVGLAYTRNLDAANVTFLGNFTSNSFSQDVISGGVEVALLDMLYVRGGYNYMDNMDFTLWEAWSVGAGLDVSSGGYGLTFDYAYRPVQEGAFNNVNMFTLGVNL